MLKALPLLGALLLSSSAAIPVAEPPPEPEPLLSEDTDVVELIKLKLMVKYRKQIALAMKLDKALPPEKRGHLDALFFIIDLELVDTLEALKVDDPLAPLAIPRDGPIS